ncbi:hypothetical protein TNCV_2829201 [Trichonephila clavipes]|nr:hypothetical protein TNCV_2829201 [Trichonephila clavipes]
MGDSTEILSSSRSSTKAPPSSRGFVLPGIRTQTVRHRSQRHYTGWVATRRTNAAFTPRQPASSVERLANYRLYLARDEVSDWLDPQRWLPWCECGFRDTTSFMFLKQDFTPRLRKCNQNNDCSATATLHLDERRGKEEEISYLLEKREEEEGRKAGNA